MRHDVNELARCSAGILREVSAEGFRVVEQEAVDQTKELHDPLILPQVLMTLQ